MKDKRAKIFFVNDLLSKRLRFSRAEISRRFEERFEQPLKERTFYDYITALEDEDAPIKKTMVGKETFYEYERDFSLTKNPLKPKDAQKLKQILKLLDQMAGLPQIEDLRAIVKTLENQANMKYGDAQPTILLDHKPTSEGVQYVGALDQHIEKKEVIFLEYRPFYLSDDKPPLKIQVHPYFLKEYERYWHLFAWNDETQSIKNYPLDRIQQIKIATGISFRKPTCEPSTYFENIIGVTRFENYEVETYRIWVNTIIAAYWRNRKLHASQVEKENVNNGFVFEFKLRWNFEWQNKILYYGKNVEVLEPIKFRNDIQNILKMALTLYDEPPI